MHGLVSLFGIRFPTYFLSLGLGFAIATMLAARMAKRTGLDPGVMVDLGLGSVILGILGARLMHVFADGYFMDYVNLCLDPQKVVWPFSELQCKAEHGVWNASLAICRPRDADCFAWARFWAGGLTYYGGLLLTLPFAFVFLRRRAFPIRKAADFAAMMLPLGLFWGRLGCFFAGCCFGRPYDWLGSVAFPAWSAASRSQWRHGLLAYPYQASLPVHPTQLYEAFGCLLLAGFAMLYAHPRKRFDGQVLLLVLGGYALLRFALEFLRADDRGSWMGVSTSQWIGLAVLGVVAWLWRRWRLPIRTRPVPDELRSMRR